MPSPSYETNKVHIYKWRSQNLDQYRAIGRKYKRKNDAWKKIQKEFFNILL